LKVIDVKKIKNCKQNAAAVDILLDSPIDKQVLSYLSQFGQLKYLSKGASFYELKRDGEFLLKGLENKKTVKLYFYSKDIRKVLRDIRQIFNNF